MIAKVTRGFEHVLSSNPELFFFLLRLLACAAASKLSQVLCFLVLSHVSILSRRLTENTHVETRLLLQ